MRLSEFQTLARALSQTLARTAAMLAVAGCASTQSPDLAPNSPAAPAMPSMMVSTAPDATGVVTYDGYQAAVVRSGDTVASVAQRIGLSASILGAYNGLSPTQALQPGDEMVLPPRSGGYSAAAPAAAPLDTGAAAGATDAGAADPTKSDGLDWNPDLVAAAIERAPGFEDQNNLVVSPSTEGSLLMDPQVPGEIASPQLRQHQTPTSVSQWTPAADPNPVAIIISPDEQVVEDNAAIELAATTPELAGEFRLIRPVIGPILIGFNQGAGLARNDGTDFAALSGAPVVAAASGEVALVSQSLSGLGTVVFLRHQDDYLTVYGRIEQVTIGKGDFVNQGQRIGVVSPSTEPRMHFEVHHGAKTLDPVKFF